MASRSKRIRLISQAIILLVLAWSQFKAPGAILPKGWLEMASWPYTVAATFFSAQFLVGASISFLAMPSVPTQHGAEVYEHVQRLRQVALIMTFVAFICSGYYLNLALATNAQSLISQTNWRTGEEEIRLMGRYWLWAVLAPMQWVSYARLYTTASAQEVVSLITITSLVMLFGLRSATERSSEHGQGKFFFAAAFACFVLMFREVEKLPLDPGSAPIARKYRRFAILLWVMYPAFHLLRSFGVLSFWQEQVLAFTLLDVIAKGVSLSLCFCGPIFQMFLSSLGNLQIQSAMIDWRVCVGDPDWKVRKPSTEALAAMQRHWLGGDAEGRSFLEHVLANDQSRAAVVSAAESVDACQHFTTQKVPVTLRLAHGAPTKALIFVSRAVWGSRQLAIAFLQVVESEFAAQVASSSSRTLGIQDMRSPSASRVQAAEEASENGTVRTGMSSIGSAIPLFRTDGRMPPMDRVDLRR